LAINTTDPVAPDERPAIVVTSSPRIYYGYWLVGAAFIAQFVSVGAQNYIIGPFFEPMTTDLGWTRSEYTLARTLGMFVMAFTGFFVGAYVDRHGGRRLMMIGIVILSAAMFALSYVEELWQWILLNGLILTVGAALIGNLVVNVTLSKWFVEHRGRAIGWASMGVSMAGVALTPTATAIIDEWGWRAAWQIFAIGAVALILPLSFVMRRAPEDHGWNPDGRTAAQVAAGAGAKAMADFASSLTRSQALRTPTFYMLVIAFGMFMATIGVMLLQTIPFMTDAGYSRATASLMITVSSIPALVSKPVWGWLVDKWDGQKLASISAALTGTAMVLITLSVHTGSLPFVYFAFFVLGCGWGGLIPLQEVIWATFFGRRYLGAVRSAGLPFTIVLGAGAPLLASFYFDQVGNYDGVFYAVAGLNFGAAIVLLLIPRPLRSAAE
jgi:MFS transporter, OFA family, oxalate/formate antiporter